MPRKLLTFMEIDLSKYDDLNEKIQNLSNN